MLRATWKGAVIMTDKLVTAGETSEAKKPKTSTGGTKQQTSKRSGNSGGDSIVAVRDYVTGKGYSGVVDWDGEKSTVGGIAIEPEYVLNGVAYVKKDDADYAVDQLEERNGIVGRSDIMDMYNQKYGQELDDAMSALIDRDEFMYDPESDPVYGAYKDMYLREAENAYRSVLNDNNTSEFGASGAVLSSALANRNAYLRELADTIPTLAEDAYDRYVGETQRLTNNLEQLTYAADGFYDKYYTADRDAIADINAAGAAEREEKQRWVDNERNNINDYYDNSLDALEIEKMNAQMPYYGAMAEQELRSAELDNMLSEQEYRLNDSRAAMEQAQMRGFFVSEDEEYLPWLADYRTAGGYSIEPWTAEAQRAYAVQIAQERAKYESSLWGIW